MVNSFPMYRAQIRMPVRTYSFCTTLNSRMMNNLRLNTRTICTERVSTIHNRESSEVTLITVMFGVCMLRSTAVLLLVLRNATDAAFDSTGGRTGSGEEYLVREIAYTYCLPLLRGCCCHARYQVAKSLACVDALGSCVLCKDVELLHIQCCYCMR